MQNMHCGDGGGGTGTGTGHTTREGFSRAHGVVCAAAEEPRGGVGDAVWHRCRPRGPPGDGVAETLGMGMLAALSLQGVSFSLHGGKIRSRWGKHQQDPSQPRRPAASLTVWVPTLPTPSPDLPARPGRVSAGWAGRAWAQPGHRPNPGHPTAAARRSLFNAQLPLFLPFHSSPSAAGTPSASAGRRSIASASHPHPRPAQAQLGNKTSLRAETQANPCGPKPTRG